MDLAEAFVRDLQRRPHLERAFQENRMNRAVQGMQESIFRSDAQSSAALAIRQALNTLIEANVCTEEEFMGLIDLDQQSNWNQIASDIADKLEPLFRNGIIHPNSVKPWQLCKGYRDAFGVIANMRAWRSANAAINSILRAVDRLYEVN